MLWHCGMRGDSAGGRTRHVRSMQSGAAPRGGSGGGPWQRFQHPASHPRTPVPRRRLRLRRRNHLDLFAVLWLEDYLCKWPKTLLVVSHAREFLNAVCTDILHLHSRIVTTYK